MEESMLEMQPEGERWDPLGAPNDQDSDEHSSINKNTNYEYDGCSQCHHSVTRLKSLEQEQEVLNSSLLALTTHFAQVQFRLKQIVNAPPNDKEEMLKALEEFAFKGVPDVHMELSKVIDCIGVQSDEKLLKTVQVKQNQHQDLINQLKTQLKELESYAFEIGEAGIPQDVLLERQKVILDELKVKMNLNLDELQPQKVTADELRNQVNKAVGSIVSPYKMKEHLVNQLKTQVADLERFIQFLQADVTEYKQCNCCQHRNAHGHKYTDSAGRELRDSIHMVKRAANLLQMFALLQFGCSDIKSSSIPHHFRKNDIKNPVKVNHWGDVRARLQIAVSHILDLTVIDQELSGDYRSDTDESPTVPCNVKVTCAVRKHLAVSLRDLMQHGLTSDLEQNSSLVPFIGCFSKKSLIIENGMHAWELIMMYYTLKNGEQYNTTPARKLSQSFNLDIVGGTVVSNKQSLLSTIGSILSTHTKYKRSNDSHFKAFVCAALNCNKLVVWLKLIYQCRQLIHMYYYPWSYAIQTGFQDALHCLDALTNIHFDLPVDLAVRQFQSIKDVFT